MTTGTIRTVAAIYDIHGNLPALNAVLTEVETVQPDLVVVGGDIVSGPMPRATLDRLLAFDLQIRFIRGNGDREVVTVFDGKSLPESMSEDGRQITQWVAEQLTRVQRDFLAQLPVCITLPVEGGDVLFCHATPHSDEAIFMPLSTSERMTGLFAGVGEPFVICGHTHMQFERQINKLQILSVGSVGMPYADQPGAYWLLIGPDGFAFRRTMYDLESAARDMEPGFPVTHNEEGGSTPRLI